MNFVGRHERSLAIATLVILSTILPELTCGDTPATLLLRPVPFLFFVVTYGVPVLVLREWTTRRGLGPGALFAMGGAYGLLNEALFAKTIFHVADLPLNSFDGAGMFLGINLPWTLFICAWHALASVVLPVAITHSIFPRQSWATWLPRGLPIVLLVPVLLLASLTFLSPVADHEGSYAELVTLLIVMSVVGLVARRIKGGWTGGPDRRVAAALAGAAALVVEFVVIMTAGARPGLAVFVVFFGGIVWLSLWTMRRFQLARLPALAYLGIGFYAATATLAAITDTADGVSVVLILVILGAVTWGVRRANRVTLAVPVPVS